MRFISHVSATHVNQTPEANETKHSATEGIGAGKTVSLVCWGSWYTDIPSDGFPEIKITLCSTNDESAPSTVLMVNAILIATGRTPNVKNIGLEAAGVAYSRRGVTVNDHLQTSQSHIYAGTHQFSVTTGVVGK